MPVAIPTSTREVLAGSQRRLEGETFLWVEAGLRLAEGDAVVRGAGA